MLNPPSSLLERTKYLGPDREVLASCVAVSKGYLTELLWVRLGTKGEDDLDYIHTHWKELKGDAAQLHTYGAAPSTAPLSRSNGRSTSQSS